MPSQSVNTPGRPQKILMAAGLVLVLTACAQGNTTLPDAATMPTRASADADRARHAKAMGETSSAATARQTKAIEEIEKTR